MSSLRDRQTTAYRHDQDAAAMTLPDIQCANPKCKHLDEKHASEDDPFTLGHCRVPGCPCNSFEFPERRTHGN